MAALTTTGFGPLTLATGTHTAGPAAASDAETTVTLTIDRTVAGGLNSLTSATTISIAIDQSNDGGTTWQNLASASGIAGGTVLGKGGVTETQATVWTQLNPGTSRQLRLTAIVAGPSSVTVSGSIVAA